LGNLYDKSRETQEDLKGIAISLPGIIDAGNGYISMGGAIAYDDDFYMRNALHHRCPDAKITMQNDAKCAAQAEASVGALKDVKDGVVLIFGTMIGGGIVFNHRVRQGVHFAAGEVSYILSDRMSDPLRETVWGNRCGTPALCRMLAERKGWKSAEVDGIRVFEAVKEKDPEAIQVLQEFTKNVAVQIFNLMTVLDVERFAIGGGISAQPIFVEYIKRHLEQMYAASPYFVPHAEVVACKYGNDANLVGALQYYLQV
jgi:predicted NBD/HSP70 family sugar kinase